MHFLLTYIFLFCKYKNPLILYSTLFAVLILILILLCQRRKTISKNYCFLTILYFLLWSFVLLKTGLELHEYESNHWRYTVISILFLSLSITISLLVPNYRSRTLVHAFSFCYYLSSFVIIGLYILYIMNIYIPRREDFSGFYEDRNTFSINLILLTLLYYGLRYSNTKIFKFSYYDILTFINVIIIFTTKSLTGILLVIFIIIFLFRKYTSILIFCLVLIVSTIVIQAITLDKNPLSRMHRFLLNIGESKEELNVSESAYVRPYFIITGIEIFINNNYKGVGLDNVRNFFVRPGSDIGTYLHNNYLDILTGLGLVGFVVYYMPMLYTLICLPNNDVGSRFLRLIIIIKFIYDITYSNYMDLFPIFITILSIKLLHDQKNTTFTKDKRISSTI